MTKHTIAVFRGDALVQVLDLTGQEVRIGRSPENELILKDDGKAVSRFHAELRVDKHGYHVLDLNSQNGTWVDGEKIQRSPLKSGRDIVIGPYRLIVREGEFKEGELPPLVVTPNSQTLRLPSGKVPAAPTQPVIKKTPAAASDDAGAVDTGASTLIAAPIAWVKSRPPVMYGGAAAIAVVAIVVILMLPGAETSMPSAAPAPGAAVPPASMSTAPATSNANAEVIAKHLAEAQTLIQQGEYTRAVTEHLDPVLTLEPGRSDAVQLRLRALQLAREQQERQPRQTQVTPPVAPETTPAAAPPPVATAPRVTKKVDQPVDPNALPRADGETDADWQARNAQAAAAYQSATLRLSQRAWVDAVKEWSALAEQYPGYRDVAARLDEARAGLQDAGRAALDAGKGLQVTDMPAALQQYERAIDLGVKEATALAASLRDQMQREGRAAIKSARQYDGAGRSSEAIVYFERAVRYLPAGDPDRVYAEERLRRLRQQSRI